MFERVCRTKQEVLENIVQRIKGKTSFTLDCKIAREVTSFLHNHKLLDRFIDELQDYVQIYLDEYVHEFDGRPYEADDESISVRYTYTHDENDPDANSDILKIDVFRD